MPDVFICHASEDKEVLVRPMAQNLAKAGIDVWYDEFSLQPGDSLRQAIDKGLKCSRFGVVVLSPSFFRKPWTEWELNGLVQRHLAETERIIIPIWHEITSREVAAYSPSLADIVAIRTQVGPAGVAKQLLARISSARPTSFVSVSLLTKRELAVMYRDRRNVPLGPNEQRLILRCVVRGHALGNGPLGWFWLKDASRNWYLDELRNLASEPNASGSWLALRMLGTQGQIEDLALFRRMAKSGNKRVRREAVRAVGSYREVEDLPMFRRFAANRKDAHTRYEAIRAIAVLGQTEDLPLLREGVAERNRWAAEALALHGIPEDRKLFEDLAYGQMDMVWLPADEALKHYPEKIDPDDLLCELSHPTANLDYRFVERLGEFRRAHDLPLLRKAAQNTNAIVRQRAVSAISQHREKCDLPLFRQLAEDTDSCVRGHSVIAIDYHELPEDAPLLRSMTQDAEAWVRNAALRALGKHHRKEEIPLLVQLLSDRAIDVRMTATTLLGSYKREEDLARFVEIAAGGYPKNNAERVNAIEAMAVIGSAHQARAAESIRRFLCESWEDVHKSAMKALLRVCRSDAIVTLREMVRSREKDAQRAADRIPHQHAALRRAEQYVASVPGFSARQVLLECASPVELEAWLNQDEPQLDPSLVALLDYKVYCPAWWQAAERKQVTGPEFRSTGF